MKKLFSFALIIASICTTLCLISSCDKNKQDKKYITLSRSAIVFSKDNLTQEIIIKSNTQWNFKGLSKGLGINALIIDFLEVSPYSGGVGETKVNLSVIPDNKPSEEKKLQLIVESRESGLREVINVNYKTNTDRK